MKEDLQKRCEDYIASRETVQKAFRWESPAVYSACANIFCACGQAADAERLKACRKVIRKNTVPFSRFRGSVQPFLSCLLSLSGSPEERMALANQYYRLLKRKFKRTPYLVLSAFLLADLADRDLTEENVARGQELYRRMNRKHRMLTNKTDSVFAMLLAFSGKTDDELIDDMEACYRALKAKFSGSGVVQTMSQVLSADPGAPEEKTARIIDLFSALPEHGVKYGRSGELAPLAALSLSDTPVPVLAEEIADADAFLKDRKGYEKRNIDDEQRAMNAVMIVADQYAGTKQVNTTVMTNTLDMLISKKKASLFSFFLQLLQFAAKLITPSEDSADKTESEPEGNAVPENTRKKKGN